MIVTPLITLTLGMVAKELAMACAKKLARNAMQHQVVQQHLLKKIEKKVGIKLLEEPATEQNLDLLRKVIKEELGPYMDLEELMESFQGTLEDLARQQQEILDELNDIKSLLEKISHPTAHRVTMENPFLKEEIPTELLERIISGYLVGREEAITEFNRLVDEGRIDWKIKRQLDEFKFLQSIREQDRRKLREFIDKIKSLPGSYHDLKIYVEIRQLLEIALTKEEKMVLIGWILEQISQNQSKEDIVALIAFSQLLIRLGADEYIPHDVAQDLVTRFRNTLTSSRRKQFTSTEQLEMLHFIHVFDRLTRKELQILDQLVTEQMTETFSRKSSSKHPQKTKISNAIARMIRKLKLWKSKPERSAKILESQLKQLKKRQFKRDTPLLRMQLERVTTEANLLAAFLETEWEPKKKIQNNIKLDDLEYTVKEIITILNNPNLMELSDDTVLLALEALDACLFLMDIIAFRNAQLLLENSREISKALWTVELEEYRKSPKRILIDIIEEIKAESSEVTKQQLDHLLPSPPEQEVKKYRVKNRETI